LASGAGGFSNAPHALAAAFKASTITSLGHPVPDRHLI
jgi:hypothetical protein